MPRDAIGPSGSRGRSRPQAVARPRAAAISRAGGTNKPGSHSRDDIHGLARLSRNELRALWSQERGEPPPATLGRDVLALGIAYARQERRQGGLSKPITRELDRLFEQVFAGGNGTEKSIALAPPLPRSGTILVREWQGTTHHVTVADGGFLWNGQSYRSLSSIARAITGTNWNGPRFFGMRERNGTTAERSGG